MYKFINKNFLIRIRFYSEKKTRLLSAKQLNEKIGDKLFLRMHERLKKLKEDKYTIRLRRGLKIDFIGK